VKAMNHNDKAVKKMRPILIVLHEDGLLGYIGVGIGSNLAAPDIAC